VVVVWSFTLLIARNQTNLVSRPTIEVCVFVSINSNFYFIFYFLFYFFLKKKKKKTAKRTLKGRTNLWRIGTHEENQTTSTSYHLFCGSWNCGYCQIGSRMQRHPPPRATILFYLILNKFSGRQKLEIKDDGWVTAL